MQFQSLIFTHPTIFLLEKCRTLKAFKQIHGQMITTGLIFHTYPLSRILQFSSRPPLSYSVCITYVIDIFNQILNPSVFLYNILISSLADNNTHMAFSLYSRVMSNRSTKPNNFTYPSLFKACSSWAWFNHGRALHGHVVKFLEPACDQFVLASLVKFYSKFGKLLVARHLFDQILEPDLASWNSILSAYSNSFSEIDTVSYCRETSTEALFLFNDMLSISFVKPNEITIVALLRTCAKLEAFCQGVWVHSYIIRRGLKLNQFVSTSLIHMYGKCGYLDLAIQTFEKMTQHDNLCYNAIIHACAIHGETQKAFDLFGLMRQKGVKVDDATLLVILCACSHAGWVDEGLRYFHSMEETFGVKPKVEHYGCLVDLLGRAGRVRDARTIIEKMPMAPNAVLWRSLLAACRIYGDTEVGEFAVKHLIQLGQECSENYILLSNIYAENNRWDGVNRVRKMIKDEGIKKLPGSTLIEDNGMTQET